MAEITNLPGYGRGPEWRFDVLLKILWGVSQAYLALPRATRELLRQEVGLDDEAPDMADVLLWAAEDIRRSERAAIEAKEKGSLGGGDGR